MSEIDKNAMREPARRLDLRGVACPLNWARAKAALALMANGELLELLVDDPRAPLDIPRAAEAEGHVVLSVKVRPPETPSPGSAGETSTILLEK